MKYSTTAEESAEYPAGSLGASTATIGYVHGDEEMAATAQAAAGHAASSGDLSFFSAAGAS